MGTGTDVAVQAVRNMRQNLLFAFYYTALASRWLLRRALPADRAAVVADGGGTGDESTFGISDCQRAAAAR